MEIKREEEKEMIGKRKREKRRSNGWNGSAVGTSNIKRVIVGAHFHPNFGHRRRQLAVFLPPRLQFQLQQRAVILSIQL